MTNDAADPEGMLRAAGRVQAEVRRRGRWYPPWLLVFAALTVVLVGTTPLVHGPVGAFLLVVALVVAIRALRSYADRRPVSARGGQVRVLAWLVAWLVLYLLTVVVVGPRWFGEGLAPWFLAGVVVALPPATEAVLARRRLSR